MQIAQEGTIEPLLAVIHWIGSLHIDKSTTQASLLDDAYHLLYEPGRHINGYLVQGMMLLVSGLSASGQQQRASHTLADAKRVAIHIGLNTQPYAAQNDRGVPAIQESWRQTWRELFLTEGILADVRMVAG